MPGHDEALSRELARQPSGSFRRDPTPSQQRQQQSSSAFSPQDMNIQPAPSPSTPFSPQDMNIPPAGGGSDGSGDGSQDGDTSSTDTGLGDQTETQTGDTGSTDNQTGKKKKKFGIDTLVTNFLGNNLYGAIGGEFMSSWNATEKFYTSLLTDGLDEMDKRQRVVYASLLADGLAESTLSDYVNKNNLDPEEISTLATETKRLKDDILSTADQAEEIYDKYMEGKPKGFKGTFESITGTYEQPQGTLTRQQAEAMLDGEFEVGMAYLDKANPKIYDEFQPYATGVGIEKLAGRKGIADPKTESDKRYNARILEARRLNQLRQERIDANMRQTTDPNEGRGFTPPPPPPPGTGTPPPGTGTPPGTPPPGSSPVPAPPTGIAPTPFDYSQFPQFNFNRSPYAQQGLGGTPQFGDFQETLDRFFRFR